MSAPPPEPDQPSFREGATGRRPPGRSDGRDPAKLVKGLALISSSLAVLILGIVIGNAARKRIDKWAHGYS